MDASNNARDVATLGKLILNFDVPGGNAAEVSIILSDVGAISPQGLLEEIAVALAYAARGIKGTHWEDGKDQYGRAAVCGHREKTKVLRVRGIRR